MDEEPPRKYRPPSPAKLSRTPSWILVGFIVGAAAVWLLPNHGHEKPPKATAPALAQIPPVPAKPRVPEKRRLTDIEAVFEAYEQYAVWDQNRTEVALWNGEKNAFADFYEVVRVEGSYYFRSLPRLTRPMITRADKPELPLVFTESEEMRRAWIEARKDMAPAYVAPTVPSPEVHPIVEKPAP